MKPNGKVNHARLKKMICSALDDYLTQDRVSEKAVHNEAKQRHGAAYRSPGYYLRGMETGSWITPSLWPRP